MFVFLTGAALCLPEQALAGGITEFAGPLEQVVNTLRGPLGKVFSLLMIVVCGLSYWLNRGEETGGLWKSFAGVVVIISMISFSGNILDKLFTFSGAVL